MLCNTTCFHYLHIFQKRVQEINLVICLCERFISIEKGCGRRGALISLNSGTVNYSNKLEIYDFQQLLIFFLHASAIRQQEMEFNCPYWVADEKE